MEKSDPDEVQVESAFWQKLLGVFISALLGSFGLAMIAKAFFPSLTVLVKDTQSASASMRLLLFLMGAGIFTLGAYPLWDTLRYRMKANREGIYQRTMFGEKSVCWNDVAFYSMEKQKWHQEQLIEPVLRNAEGRELFRAAPHVFVSSSGILRDRQKFWQFVEAQLAGRQGEIPPPQLLPLSDARLKAAWLNLKLRKLLVAVVQIALLPASVYSACVFSLRIAGHFDWRLMAMALFPGLFIPATMLLFAASWLLKFRCPRCRCKFVGNAPSTQTTDLRKWKCCASCGLPLWAARQQAEEKARL